MGEDSILLAIGVLRNSERYNARSRMHAAMVLAQIGLEARAATPALCNALKDQDPEVSRLAAWSLGQFGPEAKDEIAALIDAKNDPSPFPVDALVRSEKSLFLCTRCVRLMRSSFGKVAAKSLRKGERLDP